MSTRMCMPVSVACIQSGEDHVVVVVVVVVVGGGGGGGGGVDAVIIMIIIIKNKRRENMHTDRCGNIRRYKCRAKGSGKEEFRSRDKTNVEPEIYDYTSNNWSLLNSNEKLKEKFGSYTRKTVDSFTTKDGYTWNIIHNAESTAV